MNPTQPQPVFVKEENLPFLPIAFQFFQGSMFENYYQTTAAQRITVHKYQTDMFETYPHYKPISKIINHQK